MCGAYAGLQQEEEEQEADDEELLHGDRHWLLAAAGATTTAATRTKEGNRGGGGRREGSSARVCRARVPGRGKKAPQTDRVGFRRCACSLRAGTPEGELEKLAVTP